MDADLAQLIEPAVRHLLLQLDQKPTLLDDEPYPAVELILLYHERWEEELVFDEQKTHQDPRRATKPAHLRSQTPAGVIQEVYAVSLGHFVTRALMVQAARTEGLDTDRLSFLGCLQILKCRLPECDSRTPQTMQEWYEAVLWEMAWDISLDRQHGYLLWLLAGMTIMVPRALALTSSSEQG